MYSSGIIYKTDEKESRDCVCLSSRMIEGLSKDSFILRASGNGMKGAGITDGDLLIFDPRIQPESSSLVYLSVYGVSMCRRVFFEGGSEEGNEQIRIRREDSITPDLVIDMEDVEIHASFIGLIRPAKRRKREENYQIFNAGTMEEATREDRSQASKEEPSQPPLIPSHTDSEPDLSMNIGCLGLPAKVSNCLTGIGLRTVQDILDIPGRDAMLAIPGLGKASYEKILTTLDTRGYDIRLLRW